MVETWKDIPTLIGHYQVSDIGNVRSVEKFVGHRFGGTALKKSKVRKQRTDEKGYKYVILSVNGKQKNYAVHRLVAMAFLINNENKPQVNHIDGNPSNNNLYNLEWSTARENSQHAHNTGLCRKMHEKNRLTCIIRNSKVVVNLESGIFFDSAKDAAECFNIKHSTLKSYLNGSIKNRTSLIYAT